jgi:hypothetical protein
MDWAMYRPLERGCRYPQWLQRRGAATVLHDSPRNVGLLQLCTPECIELGNSAIAMVLTAHIAGQFIPSAIPNCPFATAKARIAKTVTEK